jgi:hypothetical protein
MPRAAPIRYARLSPDMQFGFTADLFFEHQPAVLLVKFRFLLE